jgi:1-acyl-sn-glycerol-3-phosphate acyltransferase
MPKGGPWVRPCRAFARILAPVPTAGRSVEDAGKLKEEVRRTIAAELPAERAARAAAQAEQGKQG